VNLEEYLKDFTGNRRFHPVRCGAIDIEGVVRDRAQLWAEALHLYKANERWWPEGDEVHLCTDEQEDRRQRDPWEATIAAALADVNETTTQHILVHVFAIRPDEQHRGHETRVGQAMTALGWTKRRRRTQDGDREYFYARPSSEPAAPKAPREELYDTDEITSDDLQRLIEEVNAVEIACVAEGEAGLPADPMVDHDHAGDGDADDVDDAYARGVAYRSVYGHDRDDEDEGGRLLQ
jgi:hypothetical protein